MRRACLLTVLAAAFLGGCAVGDEEPPYAVAEGQRLVLQDVDVGNRFALFDRGKQGRNDFFGAAATLPPDRNGRLAGWKSRYRRLESSRAPGTVVIESKVDVFGNASGAQRDFQAVRAAIEGGYVTDDPRLETLSLGDETIVGTASQGAGEFATRFYVIAWRDENAHAWVLVNGLEPLRFDDAVRLARAQAARMERLR